MTEQTQYDVTDEMALSITSDAATAEMRRIGDGPWSEDKAFPRSEWRCEVANDETGLGYFDWLSVKRLEGVDGEQGDPLLSPTRNRIVGRVSNAFAIEYGTFTARNGVPAFNVTEGADIHWQRAEPNNESTFLYLDSDGVTWNESQLIRADADSPNH